MSGLDPESLQWIWYWSLSLDAIRELKEVGVELGTVSDLKVVTCKAILLCAIIGLPALASACNTTQFNGNYGCLYCLDKGKHHNSVHVYPRWPHSEKPNSANSEAEKKARSASFGGKS